MVGCHGLALVDSALSGPRPAWMPVARMGSLLSHVQLLLRGGLDSVASVL